MFRASSAHLQEDTVVYMQPMVLSLSMRIPGGLSVHSFAGPMIHRHIPELLTQINPVVSQNYWPKDTPLFPRTTGPRIPRCFPELLTQRYHVVSQNY